MKRILDSHKHNKTAKTMNYTINPVKERFVLDKRTVSTLNTMTPNFGFNGLGEFVFRRTYSRDNEDWFDVVKRVVEGVMSIRKDHYIKNSLFWDDKSWHDYAHDMAISLFNMEWLPPGRGLWMMGSEYVYKRGSMALFNCFQNNTKFWTNKGLKSFEDFQDGDSVVIRGKDKWMDATVKCFGEQEIWKLTVVKNNVQNTIYTTENHRWVDIDSNIVNTSDLKKETQLQSFIKNSDSELPDMVGNWQVIDVEPTGETKPVWCVVEPEHEEFTLENGILTKNCGATDTTDDLVLSAEWTMDALMNGCVPPDTKILTEYGIKEIKDVQIGDKVWSYNINNDIKELKSILYLHDPVIKQEENIRIYGKFGYITTSKKHPILVYNNNTWDYKLAGEIITGDILQKHDDVGTYVQEQVIRIEDNLDIQENWKDLTVEDNNNYYCGEQSLYCSHNCGIGFNTMWRGKAMQPDKTTPILYVIPDSKEGWVMSLIKLMCSYIYSPHHGFNAFPTFDYSQIRPKGMPIRGFGGTSSGPEPLMTLHNRIEGYLDAFCKGRLECISKAWKDVGDGEWKQVDVHVNKEYSHTRLIADIFNAIGACVVAGNVRRCLPGDAMVHTDTGLVPIKDVEIGMKALTMNGYENIVNKFVQGVQKLVKIVTQDGEFKCTKEHKMGIYIDVDTYVMKKACDMKQGDKMITCFKDKMPDFINKTNYSTVEIVSVDDTDIEEETFDIEVENRHEFFCNGYLSSNSAEICLGDAEDEDFINLKNFDINPERGDIAWMSNNSVVLKADKDFSDFSFIPDMARRIRDNGEPGMINLHNIQKYGRLGDHSPDTANLVNPCG